MMSPQEQETLYKQLRMMSGSLFEKHLMEKQQRCDAELRHCGVDEFLRRQGRAELLEELLAEIAGASKHLAMLAKPKVDRSLSL